jgi:hypothetical protein
VTERVFGQDIQLPNQIIIELSPALIGGKHFVAFRRHLQGIPVDDHRAGLLVRVEAQQEVREPRIAPTPLPSLRRMVFGNAWYERWAKESPSITSSGRPESSD